MNNLAQVARPILRVFRSTLNRGTQYLTIRQLRSADSESANAITESFTAIRSAMSNPCWQIIEDLRSEMDRSVDVLESWDRPWMRKSEELSARLGIKADGGTSADNMMVSTAVRSSKPQAACESLFNFVCKLRPKIVVEMGTNVGVSGMYIASALQQNGVGKLVTLEGSHPKAALASQNFKRLGLQEYTEVIVGDFFDTLPQVLETYNRDIDLAFIDGFHDGPATVQFHQQFTRAMGKGVLIYDDIHWSQAMKQAWKNIKNDENVIAMNINGGMGICLIS